MRKTNLKFLTCLAMTVTALCALVTSGQAQPLITYDQIWQYYESGNTPANNNGVDWKATNYNDTATGWFQGYGVFAFEDTPGNYPQFFTTLTRGSPQITTYYFRTHFNFTGNPATSILYFTNYVDDGVVVYLNGFRIYDLRVPTANPVYGTFAGGQGTEGLAEVVTIAASPRLRQGDNVLAVELHDTSATSTDVVFGLGLGFSAASPIVITRQPPATTDAVAFDDVSLSVEASGTEPRYWWFFNNGFITGQTNDVLLRNNITLAQAGTYHVVVSNSFSGARSSNAVVRVVPDTFGPRVTAAYFPIGETNRILLEFNEDILRNTGTNLQGIVRTNYSGFNPTNYFVSILGRTNTADRIPIASISVGIGSANVRLTMTTNFNLATNYQVRIDNIADNRTNQIALNTVVPVGFQTTTNPITYQDTWFYNEWPESLDFTNWTALNYVEDPSRWYETRGMFLTAVTGSNNAPCTLLGWSPSIGVNTYYYRKKFVVTTNLVGRPLDATFSHTVDDGAVFYLNGKELTRFNMPVGPITVATKASSAGDEACRTNPFPQLVLARTNILAVEVHQAGEPSVNDFDTAFDAALSIKYVVYPAAVTNAYFSRRTNVFLRTTNHSLTQVSVYHTNGFGYAMDRATNLTGPWTEIQPPTNRLITPKTSPRQFYRLRMDHLAR